MASSDGSENSGSKLGHSSSPSHSEQSSCSLLSQVTSSAESLTTPGPSANSQGKPLKRSSIKFQNDWKEAYLMWPNEEVFMTCIVCSEKLTSFKVSTIIRHINRKHKASRCYTLAKKQRLISCFQKNLAKQQIVMKKSMSPSELHKSASYKLAFILANHKMAFSACEAFTKFAKAAHPNSTVFKNMASSRNTIATKTVELYEKVIRPELTATVRESPFWSVIADDSTDSAVQEQCCVYARFIDMKKYALSTRFLSFQRLVGHPDAETIYQGIMQVIGGLNLPLEKLVGFTCDGASVMISSNQGVLGKLRQSVNSKLFSVHCPPHRLVLASKTAQREIPGFVEKLISDVLFYFRDSSTRRDKFMTLLQLTDPDHEYVALVQYHKIRWLSLSDCVNRVCNLLPSLVRYFDEEMRDTKNRIAVRKKAENLHARIEDPLFALYLYFLQPNLDILADINR